MVVHITGIQVHYGKLFNVAQERARKNGQEWRYDMMSDFKDANKDQLDGEKDVQSPRIAIVNCSFSGPVEAIRNALLPLWNTCDVNPG